MASISYSVGEKFTIADETHQLVGDKLYNIQYLSMVPGIVVFDGVDYVVYRCKRKRNISQV